MACPIPQGGSNNVISVVHGAKEICWYVHVNVVGGSMMEQKKKQ